MTFGRWYPLREASQRAPSRPGVLQVRVEQGLIDYPRGKSAMIHYQVTGDLGRAAAELAADYPDRPWLCRHTEEISPSEAADLDRAFQRLLDRFRVRFGSEPTLPT